MPDFRDFVSPPNPFEELRRLVFPEIRSWTVYYGRDDQGSIGWHASEGTVPSDAERWASIVLQKGWAKEVFLVQAPSRYYAVKLAKEGWSIKELKG